MYSEDYRKTLYIATVGNLSTYRQPTKVFSINLDTFEIASSCSLGTSATNSSYLLYSLNFFVYDLNLKCFYVSASYCGDARISMIDIDLNFISKTNNLSVTSGSYLSN